MIGPRQIPIPCSVGLLAWTLSSSAAPPPPTAKDTTQGSATAASAQPADPDPRLDPEPRWYLSSRLGFAWFLHARSLALEHIVKPSAQVRGLVPLTEALSLGAAVGSVLDDNGNYGVWGLYALGRFTLWSSHNFQWGAMLGLGAGGNAAILHSDLTAEAPLLPYVYVASDAIWRLGDSMWLGIELGNEELSVMHLGAQLGLEL